MPRTFVGPLLLAIGSWPVMTVVRFLAPSSGVPKSITGQIIGTSGCLLFTLPAEFFSLMHASNSKKYRTGSREPLTQCPCTPLLLSFIVRMVLGLFTFFGWHQLSLGVNHQFGKTVSRLFMVISAAQFHWLFYAGRTLPNTFALAIGKKDDHLECLSLINDGSLSFSNLIFGLFFTLVFITI